MRLRRGAKWVFILLVFAFAFGFLFSGVGGGGGGDIISQLLGMRSGGDPVKSAEKTVKQHPRDAEAWNSLGLLYQGKGRQTDAIRAFETYMKLKPGDLLGLSQLSTIWSKITNTSFNEYVASANKFNDANGYFDMSTDPVQAFLGSSSSSSLQTSYLNTLYTKVNAAKSTYVDAAKHWERVDRRYLEATPKGDKLAQAQAVLQLGEAAASAEDWKTTITSYKEYLRLVPRSNLAPQVRKALTAAEKANSGG